MREIKLTNAFGAAFFACWGWYVGKAVGDLIVHLLMKLYGLK